MNDRHFSLADRCVVTKVSPDQWTASLEAAQGSMMDSIMVVGPGSLFRAGLVSLLGAAGFTSILEADEIDQLKHRIDDKPSPNSLLIAVARSDDDIIGTMRVLRAWTPDAKIVLVAVALDLEIMGACFAAGADGYLLESISGEALRESLKLVGAGEKVFPSELATLFPVLVSQMHHPEGETLAVRNSHFSSRELQILGCLVTGQSNKAIANDLNIAEATVKVHVKRILRKAHVANRTQAALWGVASGVTAASASRKVGR